MNLSIKENLKSKKHGNHVFLAEHRALKKNKVCRFIVFCRHFKR